MPGLSKGLQLFTASLHNVVQHQATDAHVLRLGSLRDVCRPSDARPAPQTAAHGAAPMSVERRLVLKAQATFKASVSEADMAGQGA